ncbi:hypothetical protein [Sporosarcina sp. FSL K6-1508]|uniref:hypothetical protein n=1 Tax=Sporosarcina sp. FSL K6-1508 TaxID=2921553 RepID=UPI0030F54CAB
MPTEKKIQLKNKQFCIHDSFVQVLGRKPSESETNRIANELPNHIIKLAEMWGWNDTEVGDNVYLWISDNISP